MDPIGAEMGQAETSLCSALSIRAGTQAFHERCNGKLPEWGLSFDIGCGYERVLHRFAILTLSTGSKSSD
jgi:hypothetical protein